jgi:hypothetical protein
MKIFKNKLLVDVRNKVINSIISSKNLATNFTKNSYAVLICQNYVPTNSFKNRIRNIISKSIINDFSTSDIKYVDSKLYSNNIQKRFLQSKYYSIDISKEHNLIIVNKKIQVNVSLTNYPNPKNILEVIQYFNGDENSILVDIINLDKYNYVSKHNENHKILIKNISSQSLEIGNGVLFGELFKISKNIDFYKGCVMFHGEQNFINKNNEFMKCFERKFKNYIEQELLNENFNSNKFLIFNDDIVQFNRLDFKLVFRKVWKELYRPQIYIKIL